MEQCVMVVLIAMGEDLPTRRFMTVLGDGKLNNVSCLFAGVLACPPEGVEGDADDGSERKMLSRLLIWCSLGERVLLLWTVPWAKSRLDRPEYGLRSTEDNCVLSSATALAMPC